MRGSRSWLRASKILRPKLATNEKDTSPHWRVIVIGGHTRSIGKTQLVCDVISAFPHWNWLAGKITQYGHGVCAPNGEDFDCAPSEHVCALGWETHANTATENFPATAPSWMKLLIRLPCEKPSVSQKEGEPLPGPLSVLVQRVLEGPGTVSI